MKKFMKKNDLTNYGYSGEFSLNQNYQSDKRNLKPILRDKRIILARIWSRLKRLILEH